METLMLPMKYSVRDILWFMIIVAICAGWFAEHKRQAIRLQNECSFQKWHFDVVSAVLKKSVGAHATAGSEGVTVRFSDGKVIVYARPND
jgi:hypothetical protein